jgi:DNA-binding response OmpR family regulator
VTEEGCCPTCGAKLPDEAALKWDIRSRVFINGNVAVRFTPREARVFDALWRARHIGGIETRGRFIQLAYADDLDGGPNSDQTLSVHLVHIRQKLKGSGYTIPPNMGSPRGNYRIAKEAGA